MKKIFAIIMSFQLILMPVALAEQAATGNDAYAKTGNGSSGGYDFYINQVLMVGTSTIGSTIISQCPGAIKIPSMIGFIAGSLTHFASELLGAKEKNDRNKKNIKDLEVIAEQFKKEGDSEQLEIYKRYYQEEKDNLEFLRNRKSWMIAVTAIYTASAGLAIAEEVYSHAAGVTAGTASCATVSAAYAAVSAAACYVGYAACYAAAYAGHLAACEANMSAGALASEGAFASDASLATGTAACTGLYIAPCNAYHQSYMALAHGYCVRSTGLQEMGLAALIPLAYGLVGSMAGSKTGEIGKYGTMLTSALAMIVPAFSAAIIPAYNYPIPRSITFGASAVLAGIVTSGLMKREEIAKSNLNKLDIIINDFKLTSVSEGDGLALDLPGTEESDTTNTKKKNELKKLNIVKKKECLSNSNGKWDHSSSACARPIKLAKTNFGKFNLPGINKVGNLAQDLADAMVTGDTGQAGTIAGEIGSYAARVKAETEALQNQYNDIQRKNKKPTKDFQGSIQAQVASMQASLNKSQGAGKMDLASGASLSGDEVKEKTEESVATVPLPPTVEIPVTDTLGGIGGTEEVATEPTTAASAEQSLNDFESSEQDVSKKQEVSIFKQLSNRYILNYTKIFDRKKTPEAVPEEPKKN
jgi:hypothetical protein